MKAARYLNWRVNRQFNAEDTALIRRVQQGMHSTFYRPGPLGRSEVCLRSFAAKLRRLIPETRLAEPPGDRPRTTEHGDRGDDDGHRLHAPGDRLAEGLREQPPEHQDREGQQQQGEQRCAHATSQVHGSLCGHTHGERGTRAGRWPACAR